MNRCFVFSVTLIILLSFCGCNNGSPNAATEESSAIVSEYANITETVTVPYKAVLSPIICNDTLYMAVAKEDRSETDTNRLISYDIKSEKEKVLFTSTHDLANIQCIQGDMNWLVFADISLFGSPANIYVLNLNSNEINCIRKSNYHETVYTIPTYYNEAVYWIEPNQDSSSGSVCVYYCKTQTKEVLSEIKKITTGTLRLSAADEKVIWFDSGKYYLFDTITQKIKTIPAHKNDAMNICYSDGYIFSNETDSFEQQSPKELVCINVDTREYSKLSWNFQRFFVSSNHLVGSTGSVLRFFKKAKNKISEIEMLANLNAVDVAISNNDTFITVEKNAGLSETPFSELKNETTLHIYHLNKYKY